jgi:phytoene dehydrogenase-like protein
LTAAFTAAEKAQLVSRGTLSDGRESRANKIVLLEASPTLGGRVQSEKTKDGYTLDRGFAVFIEEYPASKSILNYQDLRLGKFLPGALIKTSLTELQRVADPLRFPKDLFTSLVSNVGTLVDKLKILRLIYHVRTRSVEELFQEEEIDTLSLLEKHYGFSNKFITEFMKPFLEGIYLAPLEEQSSRMFHFVFKMFTEGAACLPEGGMGKVTEQLEARVRQASLKGSVNIDLKVKQPVTDIKYFEEDQSFLITTANNQGFRAKCVILATDGPHAHQLLTRLDEKTFAPLPEQPQRSVGCLYYSFQGDPPVVDPILILNGVSGKDDDSAKFHPVNNVCFPSAVSKGYAPEGYGLCSVTILEKACEYFKEKPQEELDRAVRKQLKEWFDDKSIISDWILQGCYFIPNAQPAQLNGPWAANVHGGRDCTSYQGKPLPRGFLICGDHMATATFNGALEAGVMAGEIAANFLLEKNPIKTK